MIEPTTTTAASGQMARSIWVVELSDMKVSIANDSFPKYCGGDAVPLHLQEWGTCLRP